MVKYWKEGLLFGIIATIYVICCQPAFSWAGYACDLGDFWYSSKNMTTLHFPGYPIYALLSWLVVRIPIGTEGFRLAMILSTIPAILTCIFVFYAVRKQTKNYYAPFVASLSLAGANIFLMQSIITEVYILTALFAVIAYTAVIYNKFRISALFVGLTMTMHPLLWPAVITLVFWRRELRNQWKIYVSIMIGLYGFSWIVGHFLGGLSMIDTNFWGFVQYIVGTIGSNVKWWFSLPLWHIHEKMYSTIVIFVVAFGLSLIPMLKFLKDWKKSGIIIASVIVPVMYFAGCTIDLTVLHLSLAAPFLAIAAGLGVDKLQTKHLEKAIVLCSLVLLCLLPLGYDIGRTLDKNLSAKTAYENFDNLPDGAIVFNLTKLENSNEEIYGSISGRENSILHTYKKETDKEIVNINIDGYTSDIHATGIGVIGEVIREELREEYNICTPYFELDEDTDSKERFWIHVELIAEENHEREVFFSVIPEDDVLSRNTTKYETILPSYVWSLSIDDRVAIMLGMEHFKMIGDS